MKILIDVQHPAHVHFYRNIIKNLEKKGHSVKLTAKDKEMTLRLMDLYCLEYEIIGQSRSRLHDKITEMLKVDLKLIQIVRSYKPDIMMGVHHESIAQIGCLTKTPSVIFTDTEEVKYGNIATFPFASVICTPSCFLKDLGRKHVRFNGYKELSYLHPNYFHPNPTVPEELGLSKGEPYIIMRFISWAASHDIGLKGIKQGSELNFIKTLEKYGQVYVTSEKKLPGYLEKYCIPISPEKMHSLLYYASLYIGEGGTMAAESAMLGTPAVHIEANPKGIATGEYSGNFLELRDRYGLLYFYPRQEEALEKAVSILEDPLSKQKWKAKREKLLSEKVDTASWMADFLDRYPESFREYKTVHI